MKTRLSLLLACLVSGACFSQVLPDWKSGVVVLASRQVIRGQVAYDRHHELILLQSPEERVVLPAFKIESFRFYDQLYDVNRQFISLPIKDRVFRIFEVVLQGKIKVLRCVKPFAPSLLQDETKSYKYYVYDGAALTAIDKFKTKIYPVLRSEYQEEIESYVREQRLSLMEMRSALMIIKRYNELDVHRDVLAQSN